VVLSGGDERASQQRARQASAGDTVLPIASASKWLAVATVLTLVDDGKLDLDVPVARYLHRSSIAPTSARLTLRQCLACTGGVPAAVARIACAAWTCAQFARRPRTPPCGRSRVRRSVTAASASRSPRSRPNAVTGKRWHELFAERLAAPLGLASTKFGTLQPVGGEPGTAALPWVAGGAVSTLDDYARFLRMLAGKGVFDGQRVLSEASVAAMWRDQVPAHVEVQPVGFAAETVRYGLGTWLETLADGVVRVSDPRRVRLHAVDRPRPRHRRGVRRAGPRAARAAAAAPRAGCRARRRAVAGRRRRDRDHHARPRRSRSSLP
jgi:CubicO group peptidase (beta-lactamase class C family)